MKRIFTLLGAYLLINGVNAQTCPTSGTTAITTNPNSYYPGLTATVNVGATSIALGAATGTTAISAGDVLLIVQMQGAEINSTNTNSYGDGVATGGASGYLNNANHLAGNMEYAIAANAVPLSGGTLNLTLGTVNKYQFSLYGTFGQYKYQVIRVGVYYDASLGNTITTPAWNGNVGGVTAIQVRNNFSMGGFTIDASGKGFRGGGGRQLGGGAGANTDYVTLATNNANGSKGEGTAGTPRFTNTAGALVDSGAAKEGYPSGSYARGAPGNAGGGGTDGDIAGNTQNSGGAGGGNGGAGGRGGNTWSSALAVGGEPGAVFGQKAANRVVMGGGGGAGSTNDGTGSGTPAGFASSGAAGGGIVVLFVKNVTTSGTINVSGANADNSVLNDGSGGGGAAGSALIIASTGIGNITVTAKGGNGGTNTGTGVDHGPGGGGGGGVVYSTGTLNGATSVAGGTAGLTASGTSFGAANGVAGSLVQNAPSASFPSRSNLCAILPVKLISFTYTQQTQSILLNWQVSDELNTKTYIVEKSTDGFTFLPLGSVASQNASGLKNYSLNDAAINSAIIYYRLKIVDADGNFFYSNIILYRAKSAGTDQISIYPNPVINHQAAILIPQQLINQTLYIRLINADGKVLALQQSVPTTNNVQVSFPATVHGMVMVQVTTADKTQLYKEKILIQ